MDPDNTKSRSLHLQNFIQLFLVFYHYDVGLAVIGNKRTGLRTIGGVNTGRHASVSARGGMEGGRARVLTCSVLQSLFDSPSENGTKIGVEPLWGVES